MPTLKEVELKIGAVKKTQKITKAMNMVAASKLKGAQGKMGAFRPYADKFAEVLGSLAERIELDEEHAPPLFVPRAEVKNIDVVLMTSDRGLCGSFNSNLIAKCQKLIDEKADAGIEVRLICIGKKGRDFFRRRKYNIADEYIGIVGGRFGFNVAINVGRSLIDHFLEIKRLEKKEVVEESQQAGYIAEHICEPSEEELMEVMLPKQIYVQIFKGLLETSTSEHAARMQAMDNATTNCKDMIESLTLAYNKARQAGITADLMDIVGGAEALKG